MRPGGRGVRTRPGSHGSMEGKGHAGGRVARAEALRRSAHPSCLARLPGRWGVCDRVGRQRGLPRGRGDAGRPAGTRRPEGCCQRRADRAVQHRDGNEVSAMTANRPAKERTRASLELLYAISRELAAQLDLREVLKRVLQLTMANVNAPSGSIIVLDERGEVSEGALAYDGKVHEHNDASAG